MSETFTITPIGVITNERTQMVDDNWGEIISIIALDENVFTAEAIQELQQFSHIEVVFVMNRVVPDQIYTGARHPRNRKDWPLVGVFAQRVKSRPNLLGVSRCELLEVEGMRIKVKGLDALDGTPVADIKPYMKEFGPRGTVVQPDWATELMKNYY